MILIIRTGWLMSVALTFCWVSGVAAASQPAAEKVSTTVAIIDMQSDTPEAVMGKAASQSRDGVVLVFEGVEPARATEVVRVATEDAIAHGYKVNSAILARVQTEPRVFVYGVEGAPFGPAINVSEALEKQVALRTYELGVTRLGGRAQAPAAAASGQGGQAAELASDRRKCRVERTTGSRVRQTRYCISDKDSRAQRDALQNTQDRGASNPDPNMGGG